MAIQVRVGRKTLRRYPAGIWCQNDVVLTSMRRHHVASTSIRRYFGTKCPLGNALASNRELNNLRMNYRFDKNQSFTFMYLRLHVTYYLGGAWHTLCTMLLSNYKRDDTIDLLP